MPWWRATIMSVARLWVIPWGLMALLSACAFTPHQTDWITVGHTTRDEVVEAYGGPDLVMTEAAGESVVYRPINLPRSIQPVEIPTAQAGPLGTVTTKMEPVVRGSGSTSINKGLRGRPDRELRIRYDAQGIVRELIR